MGTPALVVPLNQRVSDAKSGIMDRLWQELMRNLVAAMGVRASTLGSFAVTGESAAIAPTSIQSDSLAAGSYRVSYGLQVTQAATISSTVQVTIRWTSNGQAFSFTGTAIVNGTPTDQVTEMLPVISVDASTPVTYEASYASAGATPMEYQLTVVLEQLPVTA